MNLHQDEGVSSGLKPSQLQSFGLPINHDALHFEPKPTQTARKGSAASRSVGTRDTSARLRFTLEQLSEELDRRTKETQRLQDEVENATKVALEKFGCTADSSSGQSPRGHGFLASHQRRDTNPLVFGMDNLNQSCCQRDFTSSSMEALENAIGDCLQQLNETQNHPEQETSNSQEAIMNLQVQLHNVQREKNFLSDLRCKESRKHVDHMEKMLCILEELQNIKRSADQKVQKSENEMKDLNRKVESLEETVKDCEGFTLCETQCGKSQILCAENANSSKPQSLAANQSWDSNNEAENSEKQPPIDDYDEGNQQERMQNLITQLGHEMAVLNNRLSSSKSSGVGLNIKLEQLKKLAERQTLSHERHISELESTISRHKDKVCRVENQLTEIHTRFHNVQREKDQSLQQAKELQFQLHQLQSCCEEQRCEHQEEVKVLKEQLESNREQLHKAEEEKSSLQALQEHRVQELLPDRDQELRFGQRETQQCLARLEALQRQFHTLLAEQKTQTLKLDEKEQLIAVSRLQMESNIQMTVQHKQTIDSLKQENSLLSNQLNQCKLEIQQLRAELDQYKSDLAAAEFEKRELQASVAEQSLEKQQLSTQLELQRVQLDTLTEEHQELQRLFSWKQEEHKGVALKLQSQLRNTRDELGQTRGDLLTLQRADGHGFQAAQEARRAHESLQSRIRHLEENTAKLRRVRRERNLEARQQLQELSVLREERKQLTAELEALQSKDQQLRERISELKTILHKMAESFSNCQDFIQLHDQEFFRLKLQHALDLKELQSLNLHNALNDSPASSSMLTAPHSSKQIKESSTRPLSSPVKEQRGVEISVKHGPHTSNSGPRCQRTTEPRKSSIHASISQRHASLGNAVKHTSFLQLLSPGRRSPVYALLTSDPAS